MAPFGMGDLDSEHGVTLKDWSAQDFANIYVRFRPHLISHARTFLREETQAEDVVQDAFLYLMTALPELDSELGVLRFLKWKTKMLCLDIIRSSQAGINSILVPLPDEVLDESQPIDSLERADDAAIIRLALSKLNPRHREALIATLYEEKSHEEVARQMGVGENALRQLLFRARASFRLALIGEAEIEGKSVAAILSIAARKNRGVSRALGATLIILGLGFVPGMLQVGPEVAMTSYLSQEAFDGDVRREQNRGVTSSNAGLEAQEGKLVSPTQPATDYPLLVSVESISEPSLGSEIKLGEVSQTLDQAGQSSDAESNIEKARDLLGSQQLGNLALANFELASVDELGTSWKTLNVSSSTGMSGSLGIELFEEARVQFAWFNLSLAEDEFALVPRTIESLQTVSSQFSNNLCSTVVFTDFVAGNLNGSLGSIAIDETQVGRNALILELCWDPKNNEIIHSSVVFTNKT